MFGEVGGLFFTNRRCVRGDDRVEFHFGLDVLSATFLDLRSLVTTFPLFCLDDGGLWGEKCSVTDEGFPDFSNWLW